MNIFDIIISFSVSLLIGMGVGGGGILTVYLTVIGNIGQAVAQGINLLAYSSAALAATPVHLKNRDIDRKKVAFMAFCSGTGGVIGAIFAKNIPGDLLKTCFSVLMIGLGIYGGMKSKKRG